MKNRDLADIVASDKFRDTLLARAEIQHPYPMWHGWALMDAFLAGAKYARSERCEAERDGVDGARPEGANWKKWTESPPDVDEPTAYVVLTHNGDGSHEGWNDLKLGIAEWGPQLMHGPGSSNWPGRIGCAWDRMYIRFWVPIDLGASCKALIASIPVEPIRAPQERSDKS